MTTNPSDPPQGKRLTIALAIFALIVVPLGAYVAGYVCSCEILYWYSVGHADFAASRTLKPGVVSIERSYPQRWLKNIYQPAAGVEGWLRGLEVQTTCDDDWTPAEL